MLVFYLFGNSQSYYSKNITSSDGLPDNAIRSIYEDSRGYLWIGTDAGVSCWDGEIFNTYNTLDGLAGNKVWWIDEDEDGNMWFACFGGGLSRFNGQLFTSYTITDGLVDNSVRVVKYSPALNCLLIGTNKAISVLKDSIFYNFSKKNGQLVSDVIITSIITDSNKAIFVDFRSNYYAIGLDDENKPILKPLNKSCLDKYNASSCFISSSGDTIIGWKRKGIAIYDGDSITEINRIGQVFGITEDRLGNFWIASWNGGGLSPPGGLFVLKNNMPVRLNNAYDIQSIIGWSTFFKKDQNLIFYGTLDNGLYKIPPQYFEYYSPKYFEETSLSIKDIEIDANNNIWFITDSLLVNWDTNSIIKNKLGIFYDLRLNHEIKSASPDDFELRIKEMNERYNNRNPHFSNIEFDSKGDAWLSIENLGFFNISKENPVEARFHSTYVSTDFVFDESDTLFQCDEWSSIIRKFLDFEKSNDIISYKDSLHPVFSRNIYNYKNEVWACSRISDVFLLKDERLRTITTDDSTINKIVNDICFDNDGFAYLGGSDGRIEILAPVTREKIFEINHEEYDNSVHWLEVSENMLFTGYSDGLRVYMLEDIKNNKSNFMFFRTSEGYTVKEVNNSLVDKNNNIWLATNNGLVKINTELFT